MREVKRADSQYLGSEVQSFSQRCVFKENASKKLTLSPQHVQQLNTESYFYCIKGNIIVLSIFLETLQLKKNRVQCTVFSDTDTSLGLPGFGVSPSVHTCQGTQWSER